MNPTTSPDAAPADETPIQCAVHAVDRFFFRPSDPTTLGLMRVCAGLLLFYIHLIYCVGLTDYLGPDAWINNGVTHFIRNEFPIQGPSSDWNETGGELLKGQMKWSIFFHVEAPKWVWTIHLSYLLVLLLFTAGLGTRVTSVLAWLGALMYIQRLEGQLFGLDTMTNLALIYLMIAPCGAALSLDRWLEVRRQRWQLGDRYVPQPPPPLVSATFATRLVQINFCILYFAAGTSKLLGTSWWNATAPNRFLLNYSFAPFDVSYYVQLMKFLASHRWMWELFGAFGVLHTLAVELGFPFLVWNRRARWVMVCGSILLHTAIALLMGLVTFSLMMLVLVLAFVPPEAVRPAVQRVAEPVRGWFAAFARGAAKRQAVGTAR